MKNNLKIVLCCMTFAFTMFFQPQNSMFLEQTTVNAAETVKLNKEKLCLIKGQTTKLRLKGAKGKIQWKSKKKSIVSVKKNGTIKARKVGKTKVYAICNNKTYKCTVLVENPQISNKSLALEVGKTATLKMQGTKQNVKWRSQNTEIVTIDQQGIITAKVPGNTVVIGKVGAKEYHCNITVMSVEKINETESILDIEAKVEGESTVSLSQSKITIYLKNKADNSIYAGDSGYTIEKNVNGEWIAVYSPIVTAAIDTIEAGKELRFIIDFAEANLKQGEYRFSKSVFVGNKEQRIYVEFTIIE